MEAATEKFCAEKVAVVEDQSNETCHCGEKLALVRVIVDSLTRDTIRLFKCQCGERAWQE
jgi:hypothetical protein